MNKTFLICMFSIILALLASSCSSLTVEKKARNLEIGMTKKEVMNIMGNNYTVMAARDTPDGAVETISYLSTLDPPFVITFLDGRVVEWYMDRSSSTPQTPPPPPSKPHHHD